MMNCKICNSPSRNFYEGIVLGKHHVAYYKCDHCGFIQTGDAFWLKEAYENVITQLDIGLVSRNLYLKNRLPGILMNCFPDAKTMLDYGGGYGLLVRMMRDEGFNFYRQDIYCENLFARYFDISDAPVSKFDVLTAFEVFEHLENPLDEIAKMFSLADNIVFTTEIVPDNESEFAGWWYVSPLTGQHIAFYSQKSLFLIAEKFNRLFYSNGRNLHVFSARKLEEETIQKALNDQKPAILVRLNNFLNRKLKQHPKLPSLLEKDYTEISEKLKSRL
jgi:hypothetical protein